MLVLAIAHLFSQDVAQVHTLWVLTRTVCYYSREPNNSGSTWFRSTNLYILLLEDLIFLILKDCLSWSNLVLIITVWWNINAYSLLWILGMACSYSRQVNPTCSCFVLFLILLSIFCLKGTTMLYILFTVFILLRYVFSSTCLFSWFLDACIIVCMLI